MLVKLDVDVKLACLAYKLLTTGQHVVLRTLLHHYTPTPTLQSTNQFFVDVRKFSTEFGERLFRYFGPTIWNGPPLNIGLHPLSTPSNAVRKLTFSNCPSTPLPCCPPCDCQRLWFSIITELARVINACIIIIMITWRCVCPAVMSNEELYDRMRQQRMLREELRDKKKELEDMMRKEHSLKQNSRNQDTQSDVVSYSNKSDAFGLVLYYLLFISAREVYARCPLIMEIRGIYKIIFQAWKSWEITRDHSFLWKILPNSAARRGKIIKSTIHHGIPFTNKLHCLKFNYWRLSLR